MNYIGFVGSPVKICKQCGTVMHVFNDTLRCLTCGKDESH